MSHHFQQLQTELLKRSAAKDWPAACKEWRPRSLFHAPGGTCTCGYHPITQQTILQNQHTGHEVIVGRICVKQFLDFPEVERFFSALERCREPGGTIPEVLRRDAHKAGLLSEREFTFLCDIAKKRRLSAKQARWREHLRQQIVAAYSHRPRIREPTQPKSRSVIPQRHTTPS